MWFYSTLAVLWEEIQSKLHWYQKENQFVLTYPIWVPSSSTTPCPPKKQLSTCQEWLWRNPSEKEVSGSQPFLYPGHAM